jgi:hypothetical protein
MVLPPSAHVPSVIRPPARSALMPPGEPWTHLPGVEDRRVLDGRLRRHRPYGFSVDMVPVSTGATTGMNATWAYTAP